MCPLSPHRNGQDQNAQFGFTLAFAHPCAHRDWNRLDKYEILISFQLRGEVIVEYKLV